jgi:capsular exopolysaccharide synthesis family protein
MVSQDKHLLPLSNVERGEIDRPLRDIMQPKSYGAAANEPAHLREYLSVILKRKWLILSLIVVVTSLVAIQMYRQPSIYEATTTILIQPKQSNVFQGKELVINSEDPAYRQTQLRLLQSPALARQVILSLNLQNNPAFFGGQSSPGIIASLRKVFSRGGAQATAPQQQAPANDIPVVKEYEVREQLTPEQIERLQPYEDTLIGNMTIEPEPQTNLVRIGYKHTDPIMAQVIANKIAEVFALNTYDRETMNSRRALELIAKELADLQARIRQSEEAKIQYAMNKNLPTTQEPGGNIPQERLTKLSAQLLEAEEQRKNLQSLYEAALRQEDRNAVPEVMENKRIQALREKLDALRAQREELLVVYTPEWPAVKRLDAQIKNIEEAVSVAPKEVISSMKARYEAALAKENALRRDFEAARGVTSQQSLAQIQMSMLNQQLETDKQYAAMLLQRQREIQMKESDRQNNISVVNVARPGALVGPPRGRNIFIAFLLALAAGIGLAFLLDYLDDSLKSVDDVDRYLHLPALALIPASREEGALRGLKGRNAPGEENEVTALALINDARSPAAEAYRHLRTSLLLSSAGQPPKTILVTSSQPSEGKTTTAVNTAVMLAQTGAEVLIVDCDLRRPRVHAHFGVSNTPGLTNYLSGESDLESVLQFNEKLPQLKLLTSGPIPPNPAELLGSNEMRKLLLELSDRFTHVIIDSPPAISFTDASVLSTLVDGVMLVVHGGRSSRAVVRRAKQQLVDVGANIFGIVLNNVKLEAQDYYYYGGYYSSYYSSEEETAGDAGAAASGAGANGSAG